MRIIYLKRSLRNSGQDRGVGRYTLPPHTTKRKTTTNLKTKNNQNCHKNQTVWKSNNQEVKETFIQTGRRGRDRQLGQRGHAARRQLEDPVGEAADGRSGEAVAGRLGGPTFACG